MDRGKRIRLVARGTRRDGHPVGRVAPEELDAADPLANLAGQQNLLVLQTDVLGDIGLLQLDGGLIQTAYGLLADGFALERQFAAGDHRIAKRLPGL